MNSLRCLKRLGKGRWWHLCVGLGLPLLLLLAQHGSLLHGLSHYVAPHAADGSGERHLVDEACGLCVAFAPVNSVAVPDGVIPRLLAALAFHAALSAVAVCWVADLPQRRSRGPPSSG